MGFGVMLNIRCLVFHRPVCEMLIKAIAPETKEIVLHRKWIPIKEFDFEKVMGFPNGTHEVGCDMNEFDETCIRMKNLMIKKGKHAITFSCLVTKIKNMKDADDVFKIAFIFVYELCLVMPFGIIKN
ncbi:hypothetical protein Dsin_002272 [Dipteronia sinensis]|uniref:Uncharacterized protein n=1 Tax=Dipteronia sinensis TaxID=43782 RepID=A0AAE0EJ88_9ROSI|nr:hypothetical protein Dsin_002272 [Dipteronia sinensis]